MPVDRWSTAQVVALAPDPGAAKAARGVSAAAAWSATGLTEQVLWGLCRGSGKNPYQVCVDLSGPAYRCSCPSRKFPCKHALGLLLLWAEHGTGDAAAPDWVLQWRASRAARVAAPRTTTGPVDPAAAAKRVQQRAERVSGGLQELRRWLDDQVQQGLAAAQNAGPQPYEAMAARLVDAQAPTAAAAVRRPGRLVGVGAQWADRLLGELALLRLLVTAYDRLDGLPTDLAATVRTRIGFPTPTEQVLATRPVRDRWHVIGQVDTVDDKVITRRSWLRGSRTHRFAMLLAFAAPGQAFPADVVPGTELDADLCFYPGAYPLRALLATRHAAPEVTGAPAGAVGVGVALGQYAAALAADPWRESVPVLLAGVVPTDDGHLVDRSGDALPLLPGHDQPWWLLAAAGGQPVDLAGELGPAGLRPLSAWPNGRYLPADAAVPAGAARRGPTLPAELLSTALVGTARRPFGRTTVPVDGRPLVVGGDGTAGALLEATAVAVTYRRAGAPPVPGRLPVAPVTAEDGRSAPAAAAARLHRLLAEGGAPGGGQVQQSLLAEWLGLADTRAVLAPPETLPMLLDAARRGTALRATLARVAGQRGRWLAEQRPDWGYLLDEAPVDTGRAPAPAGSDEDWQTGTTGQRVAYLQRLRARDPAAGRELLAATFAAESPHDRVRFVEALSTGLSADDDGFLERVLDDRRKEVRQAAVELLRALPRSALGRRMADRALACVRLDRRSMGRYRIMVTAPADCDASMRRDGVQPHPPRGVGLGAWLLEEVIAAAPLDTWTTAFDRSPAQVLGLPVADTWGPVLQRGWARAAVEQHDARWAGGLTDVLDRSSPAEQAHLSGALLWQLHEVLPADRLTRLAVESLRADPARAQRLLGLYPDSWPDELASAVAEMLDRRAHGDDNPWHLGELCRLAATAMSPAFAERIGELAERLAGAGTDAPRVRAVGQLAAVLGFRSEMHKEFA